MHVQYHIYNALNITFLPGPKKFEFIDEILISSCSAESTLAVINYLKILVALNVLSIYISFAPVSIS